ncbi:MAG: HEAT repeat domain-containing protein, partial [Planctomycetota bacterium]|nr:HEAT repeat domain-containing protein [Planctomycetota bacterium]
NSAYGLAKLGDEAGLAMLQQSYYSEDTPSEYRLAILGGLADVADPVTAPIFREILTGSKDMGYLLMAIGAVEKMKDKGSLLELRAILHSDHPPVIKEKAEEAIYTIQN